VFQFLLGEFLTLICTHLGSLWVFLVHSLCSFGFPLGVLNLFFVRFGFLLFVFGSFLWVFDFVFVGIQFLLGMFPTLLCAHLAPLCAFIFTFVAKFMHIFLMFGDVIFFGLLIHFLNVFASHCVTSITLIFMFARKSMDMFSLCLVPIYNLNLTFL